MQLTEILSLVTILVDDRLLMWLPVIMVFGWIIKHKTRIPNGFIPTILLLLSVGIGSAYGWQMSNKGGIALAEAIAIYGFGQGFILAFAAVFSHSAVHGIIQGRKKNGIPTNSSVDKGEKRMKKLKNCLRSAWSKAVKWSLMPYFLAFLTALAFSAAYHLIAEGTSGIADFLTKVAISGILSCLFVDVFAKLIKSKALIVKEYWLVVCSVLISVGSLVWAFGADTVLLQGIGLGASALFAILGGVFAHWVYKPKKIARENEIENAAIEHLVNGYGLEVYIAKDIVKNSWTGAEKEAKFVAQVTGEVK